MEGDLVSVDLKTAALVIRFSSDVLPSDSEIQEPLLQVFEEQKTKLGILEKNKAPPSEHIFEVLRDQMFIICGYFFETNFGSQFDRLFS